MKKILVVIFAALLSISAFAAKPKQVETVTFKVHLHCQNCVKKVTENISFEKGVVDLKCSLENGTVAVSYNPEKTSEEKLAAAIKKLGYEVEGKVECCEGHDHENCECGHEHGEKHENCSCGGCK